MDLCDHLLRDRCVRHVHRPDVPGRLRLGGARAGCFDVHHQLGRGPDGGRTRGLPLRRRSLYPLSYETEQWPCLESNQGLSWVEARYFHKRFTAEVPVGIEPTSWSFRDSCPSIGPQDQMQNPPSMKGELMLLGGFWRQLGPQQLGSRCRTRGWLGPGPDLSLTWPAGGPGRSVRCRNRFDSLGSCTPGPLRPSQ